MKHRERKICRDCPKCTETTAKTFVMKPLRKAADMATSWNIGLFQRKCPHCGHLLSEHQDKRDIY